MFSLWEFRDHIHVLFLMILVEVDQFCLSNNLVLLVSYWPCSSQEIKTLAVNTKKWGSQKTVKMSKCKSWLRESRSSSPGEFPSFWQEDPLIVKWSSDTGGFPLQHELNSLYIDPDKLNSRQTPVHKAPRSKQLMEKRQLWSVLLLLWEIA